jgi:ribokinase
MRARRHSAGDILILGDINVDIIGRTKAWPRPGDDCLAPHLELHCGGVAANTALALNRWGVNARLVGCVGDDDFGGFLLKELREDGVDTRRVQRTTRAMTGLVYINVTPDGERTFFGSRGANRLVLPVRGAAALFDRSAGAHLMGYNFLDPGPERTARQILKALHARNRWVSLDVGMEPSKTIPRKILQLLRHADILFLSRDEAVALTGFGDPRKAFREFQKAGAREVVMKLGKRGCLISDSGTLLEVPAFSVRTVDSTGAGDAYVAAFLQARLRGWSAAEAALAANAAGAAAVGVVGAGKMLPQVLAVARLLRAQRLNPPWDAVRSQVLARLRDTSGSPRRPR